MTILDPQLEREYPDDKLGILDVRVKTKAGIIIDIEVQLFKRPYMSERITFYTSKNLTMKMGSGRTFKNVGRAAAILIANYDAFNGFSYHHAFRLYDLADGTLFTDVVEIRVFELKKPPTSLPIAS
jgi:predicted transposase/invertase (TIGR01784 family)